MRRFLVQFVIAAVSIAVVMTLLSLIHVDQAGARVRVVDLGPQPILTVVSFALMLAAANTIIRPVLLLLTGRWLIRSFGLALLVVDSIVLLIAGWLAPRTIQIAEPRWLWAVVMALLIVGITNTLEVVLGVDRPRLDVSDRQRAIWRLLDRLPTPRRSAIVENLRLMQVYDTISTFGFDIALERGPFAGVRAWMGGFLRSTDPGLQGLSVPAKVRVMLQQLGPTYVKIGQMAASRAEALPSGWAPELAKLQNTVPPFSTAEAHAAIVKDLGAPPEDLFGSFDPEPLAAASLAQVHRARLPDGTPVIVKIQRPDVDTMVRADLGVLQELAATAERRFEIARRLDLPGVVREFADGVVLELDYRNEAYHMRRMRGNLAGVEVAGCAATSPASRA